MAAVTGGGYDSDVDRVVSSSAGSCDLDDGFLMMSESWLA